LLRGNFSNVKGVGSGVFEYRIDFGPGYHALANWQDYKRRMKEDSYGANT
jgi:putative component of toxin-antitoxin plasmid stabilization module